MKKKNVSFQVQRRTGLTALAVVFALSLGCFVAIGDVFAAPAKPTAKTVSPEEAAQAATEAEYKAFVDAARPRSSTPNTGVLPYIIMRSGTVGYSMKRDDYPIEIKTSTIVLQNFIDAIRDDAKGADCTIQFGDGRTPLNTDNSSIDFNGKWGTVTLTGFHTTKSSRIKISGAVNVISYGYFRYDGTFTNVDACVFNNSGTGTLTVAGGRIEGLVEDVTKSRAPNEGGATGIINSSTGTVIVKNGTVNGGFGIRNTAAGKIIVDGGVLNGNRRIGISINNESTGTVTVNNGWADRVENDGRGTITINGGNAKVSISNGSAIINGGVIDWAYSGMISTTSRPNVTSSVITIKGGTFRIGTSGISVYPNGMVVLEGDPDINCEISLDRWEGKAGTFALSPSFKPSANRRFTLFANIRDGLSPNNFIMVEKGANFLDKFALRHNTNLDTEYKLAVSGNNIVLQPK